MKDERQEENNSKSRWKRKSRKKGAKELEKETKEEEAEGSGKSLQRWRSYDSTSRRYRQATHHTGKHQVRREVDYEDIKTDSTFTACYGGRMVGGGRGETGNERWGETEEWWDGKRELVKGNE